MSLDPEYPLVPKLVRELVREQRGTRRGSTQFTSYNSSILVYETFSNVYLSPDPTLTVYMKP